MFALQTAAPLFLLHWRQVNLMLSRLWPLVLSNRSTRNCRVSLGWQAQKSLMLQAAQWLFWVSLTPSVRRPSVRRPGFIGCETWAVLLLLILVVRQYVTEVQYSYVFTIIELIVSK